MRIFALFFATSFTHLIWSVHICAKAKEVLAELDIAFCQRGCKGTRHDNRRNVS
jgi:hypothetical protein